MITIKNKNKQNFKQSVFDFRALRHSNSPIIKAFEYLANRIANKDNNLIIEHKKHVVYPLITPLYVYTGKVKCQICGYSINMRIKNCQKMFPKLVNNIIWDNTDSYFKPFRRQKTFN